MLDNPLTAAEQRELLQRLRWLQGVEPNGFAPPQADLTTRAEMYSVGDHLAPEGLAEAAVRFAPPPRDVTGRGITSSVHMELADLGIMRWDPDRNAIAAMFGDNFSFSWGQDWQSPSIVMYDRNYNVIGIPETGNRIVMAGRRQLWEYPHNNSDYSTILPCDFIRVNGMWYVAAMVTQGLGNEKWTVFWQSRGSGQLAEDQPVLELGAPRSRGAFHRPPRQHHAHLRPDRGLRLHFRHRRARPRPRHLDVEKPSQPVPPRLVGAVGMGRPSLGLGHTQRTQPDPRRSPTGSSRSVTFRAIACCPTSMPVTTDSKPGRLRGRRTTGCTGPTSSTTPSAGRFRSCMGAIYHR